MKPILPGATIGVLGGGQLGRMFAIAARKMGYRVHTFEPASDSPAGQVADREVNRPYEDFDALRDFAGQVEIVTYEFENIPVTTLDFLQNLVPLRPGRDVLYYSQNRRREKEFLQAHDFPVVPNQLVTNEAELGAAVEKLGQTCVLKTADFGYDGKGQQKIGSGADLAQIWRTHGAANGILEGWIDFAAEISCIVARDAVGNCRTFPVAKNTHTNHILDLTIVPAPVSPEIMRQAEEVACALAHKINLIGLLAVEFFVTKTDQLLINEIAPRPHNSGHFSFDACVTSQFEQQLRAVCGLPLGETRCLTPVVMRNLLGDLWEKGEPRWAELLAIPGLKLHLYGKSEPRPGRKMGHYTILAPTVTEALVQDALAQKILQD